MDLQTRLAQALKAAMKDKDKVRVAAIRLIRDAIQKKEIEEKSALDEKGALSVLSRLIKQRQESIAAFEQGGRPDLAERERRELEVIKEFMPEPLSKEELQRLVAEAVAETGAQGPKDLGKVMKALKGRWEGRASGEEISEEAKRQLAGLNSS